MVVSIITRALILILGYAYPAYDCYKTVELNRPEVEQLRFWCQYWFVLDTPFTLDYHSWI
jgi:receptor expression-enhancing protein 1/2/3/4